MMTTKFKKARLWWCPVYYKKGNPPVLMARHWTLDWLFWLTILIHHSMQIFADLIGIEIEKGYPIKITGD